LIAENTVTIFSKSWCPYCKASKNLFGSLGVYEEGKSIAESDKKNTELELAGIKYHSVEYVDITPDEVEYLLM
jgi:glutaredoxin